MSYNNKRYKRQEDDNNRLPQVFQRLGSSSTPTYPASRTRRYGEGGGGGLRIARYNSPNAHSPQHAYPDYSKISQLREDAVYYTPNTEYAYNQPIQIPTNNFRFVRSDPSLNDVSRPIISFLRDSPVSNQQPRPPQSPPSSYTNTHYTNTHQMNGRRVIKKQDHLYQERQHHQQQGGGEAETKDDTQEHTYSDKINIDIAKKIRITASIPTSNMSNDHVDNNAAGSNINNKNQVITPKRQITVTTSTDVPAPAPRKDRSTSSETDVGSKRQRPSSPLSLSKRTRSPSPLSETGQSRRPRRLSVDYVSDEEIPFLHLKGDTYLPNYAKDDNINNRLSGVKKFKDLRAYPPLGSTTVPSTTTNTATVSHNKVWKKPECTTPLPLSKKFTPGVTTKSVDVTLSNTRLTTTTTSNLNTNQTKENAGNSVTTPTKKYTPVIVAVKSAATSTEHANIPVKVGTAPVTTKPVTAGAKPAHAGAKPVTTKTVTTPFRPVAAAPFNLVSASPSLVTAPSSKDCTVPVKSADAATSNTSASTPAAFVIAAPTITATSVKSTAEEKPTTGSPKNLAEASFTAPVDPTVNPTVNTSKDDILAKTSDKLVKPVSFLIKPASKAIKLSTGTNKALIENGITAIKLKETPLSSNNKTKTTSKSRWDALPSNYTSLEKQNNNVAENNNTVCSDTSVSTTVKHGIENQNRDISKATGSSVSQGTVIRASSNEPTRTGSTTTTTTTSTITNSTTTSTTTSTQQDERIKQDERARNLLRQMSIDEREDVVMDIEPSPARNRPTSILNIHNQCKQYQSRVITILKEEPMSDYDMSFPVENEQESVYDSLASAMQNTVDTIMGEFIGSCAPAAAAEEEVEEKNKREKKLPDIKTQESVLSNEQVQQLISPPVSSTTETPPVALPTVVAEKPKVSTSRLPAPWKVRMTDSCEIFYLNSVTGETTPTRPA